VTTQVKSTQRAKPDAALLVLTEDVLRHYTPKEVEEKRLLPCSARWLEKQAYARRIPFTQVAGKLTFRLDQLLTISQSFDVAPMAGPRAA
jgi:hypothetical protein